MTHRRGFSLIELLVVIGIIAILVALLMPAVQNARAAARRTQCKNNLHNIGIALLSYQSTYQCLPPGWLSSDVGGRTYPGYSSWLMAILPEIEQETLYNAINIERPAWAPANATVVVQRVELYLCPSDTYNSGSFRMNWLGYDVALSYSNYTGSLGTDFILDYRTLQRQPDGVLFRHSNVRMGDITDGTSTTLLAGEKINVQPICRGWWGFGATSVVVSDSKHGTSFGEPALFWGFSSNHLPGAHFVMCDGSAGLISRQIETDVLMGLSTRAGDEPGITHQF